MKFYKEELIMFDQNKVFANFFGFQPEANAEEILSEKAEKSASKPHQRVTVDEVKEACQASYRGFFGIL